MKTGHESRGQAGRTPPGRRGWLCFALLGLLLAAGCAYRLGPTNGLRSREKSIQVNPFANRILEEPRLGEVVTMALRKQVSQEGTYRLDTQDEGDIVVTGEIVDFDRQHLSFQPRDVLTPRDYQIRMFAHITARERSTGKVLVNRRVQGRTTVRIGNDLTSAERQAMPLVAEDLARNATALLVDGEW